jgi:hypothetical protein
VLTRSAVTIALVLASSLVAAGDEAERFSGFVTSGTGTLTGRVTDFDGDPLAGVDVHVVSGSGGVQIVTTDRDGHYRAILSGGRTIVFVERDALVGGQTTAAREDDRGRDVIEIEDTIPPKVHPMPLSDPTRVPEYSDQAEDENAWTRAWLLLEIDATGSVTRLKVLRDPGFGLGSIAVREGFALRFEPAQDIAGQPTRGHLLWTFEWPSYWWLVRNGRTLKRLPSEVARVPCRGSGPTGSVYRDCSRPDMTRIATAPWLAPSPTPAEPAHDSKR